MTRSVLLFGQLLDFLSDPGVAGPTAACRHVSDGALWIVNGHIVEHGPRQAVLDRMPAALLAKKLEGGPEPVIRRRPCALSASGAAMKPSEAG